MRIVCLPRYVSRGASSRYRILQYVSGLQSAGHTVEVWPMLDDAYLEGLYHRGSRSLCSLITGYARRLLSLPGMKRFEVAICEQELLPYFPAWAEEGLVRSGVRLVVDYDDAAYVKYERWGFLRGKIGRIMRAADAIVVGNQHLARYARQFTNRVRVIPTVVQLAGYPQRRTASLGGEVRVAWIGTPITARFLWSMLPIFQRIQNAHPNLRFRFIGAGPMAPKDKLQAEAPEWSEATEGQLLAECDIGIMPVEDNEFTRGKCGLKLIQYMACGLPVVASPVGANCEIVDDGVSGYLARGEDEWFQTLGRLVSDAELRRRFGESGRAKVERLYSLERGLQQWLDVLQQLQIESSK